VAACAPVEEVNWDTNSADFEHGLAVELDGDMWYFAGPGSAANAVDIPGHTWKMTGANTLSGKHYNVGPLPAAGKPWWASDAGYGDLLFEVDAIIDTWSDEKAKNYAADGFVHYHEIQNSDGNLHPNKIIWLKHNAVKAFNLDGGPHPEDAHAVVEGVDFDFLPNGMNQYPPAPKTIQVTLANVHDAQPIAPGVVVVHTNKGILDFEGKLAEPTLEPLAEVGSNAQLAEWLKGQTGVEQVVTFDAPILPGESTTLEITVGLNSVVSAVGMAVGTNDAYGLVDSVKASGSHNAIIYDAGTEANEGLLCGFECGQPDPSKGEANIENGVSTSEVVKVHTELTTDLMTVSFN